MPNSKKINIVSTANLNLITALIEESTLEGALSILATQNYPISPDNLIDIFESSISKDGLTKSGSFYTPHKITEEMRKKIFQYIELKKDIELLTNFKILDPSCGGGSFLVCILRYLITILKGLKSDTLENRLKVAESCIYGVDRDSNAIRISKLAIALTIIEGLDVNLNTLNKGSLFAINTTNLLCANSLFDSSDFSPLLDEDQHLLKEFQTISWNQAFHSIMKRENPGFDLVIGNPPYGLARGEKISHLENEKLKNIYKDYNLGKINKYMAFMAHGSNLTRQSGILSFLVPNSWLGINSATKLREILLKKGALHSITIYGEEAFPELGVETLSFIWQKSQYTKNILIERDNLDGNIHAGISLPVSHCLKQSNFFIPTDWSDNISKLTEHLFTNCFLLGEESSPFKPMIALQAYAVGQGKPPQTKEDVANHIYHFKSKKSPDCLKYLDGRDVKRYSLSWSGRYLKWGPWLSEPQSLERFLGPRILIREVSNPEPYLLSAAYTEEPLLYNKSILHILLKKEYPKDLAWALLAILNSSLAGKLIKLFGRKSQRKLFPKILNGDLKSFPLPHLLKDNYEMLAQLSKSISLAQSKQRSQNEITKLQNEIDLKVISLYNLSEDSFISSLNAA